MILGRYEGLAEISTRSGRIEVTVQLTAWQGERLRYWGGRVHIRSGREQAVLLDGEDAFLAMDGRQAYVTLTAGEQPGCPILLTGHGDPPFGQESPTTA